MEQTNFPISRNLPLKRLVTDALGEIERMGYRRTVTPYAGLRPPPPQDS